MTGRARVRVRAGAGLAKVARGRESDQRATTEGEGDGMGETTDRWTVTVSIGRNVGDEPMAAARWDEFAHDLVTLALPLGSVVFNGTGAGEYDGGGEESRTVVLADVAGRDLPTMRAELGKLAARYGQESIAATAGFTVFCLGAWTNGKGTGC